MLSLLEIAERAQKGPKMVEKDWDMKLYRTISRLVKEFDIKYPGDECWFNMDWDLVDRAFEAALTFLEEMGIYCISTNRIVQLTRQEILECIKDAPTEVIMGEGRDARVFKQRKIEGKELLNVCPGHHTPFTENLASIVVKNFAQISRTDFIEGFNFPVVDGREIIGPPLEAYAARRQLAWMREGIRKAGRPGLAIVYYPINTRVASLLAGMDPDYGLRRTDGILLSLLPGLKMEQDMLSAAITYEDYGCFRLSGSFVLDGGFCGGVEGAIIEGIAKPIAATIAYHDYIHYTGVEHVTSLSAQKILLQPFNWGRSVVNQVLNTKTNTICIAWIIPTCGSGAETHLFESAIRCIEAPINGANLYAPRHSRSRVNGGQTPLEAEWMLEVSDAVIEQGLDRSQASEILKKIAAKINDRKPEQGYLIDECYDLVHHKLSAECQKIYENVKEELVQFGLNLK